MLGWMGIWENNLTVFGQRHRGIQIDVGVRFSREAQRRIAHADFLSGAGCHCVNMPAFCQIDCSILKDKPRKTLRQSVRATGTQQECQQNHQKRQNNSLKLHRIS